MKNALFIFLAFLFSTITNAQTPQGVSYQAIAFNAGGSPIVSGPVGIKISILDNSATGTVVYSETHTKTTNAQGLFNLNVGQGTPTLGTFSTINWATNSKFLQVELDPAGGTNYTVVGASELMSVPYALYSENTNTSNIAELSSMSTLSSGIMTVVYTSTNAYGFMLSAAGNPSWYSTSLSGTPIGAVARDSSIVIYTSTNAYGFTLSAAGNPSWYSTSLSGTPIGAIKGKNGIVVYTSTNAYGFMLSAAGNPSWYSTSLSGTPIGGTANGNVFVVYTSSNAYGFTLSAAGNPSWYSISLSGTPVGIVPK